MYTTEVRGVKTLRLIASTGTEAAAAEAQRRRRTDPKEEKKEN
jgi:hypothetical protein